MRYTSSPPHAFRNRIAKSIGVLVAAALVAVTGAAHCGPGTVDRPDQRASNTMMILASTANWTGHAP